jgi:hypothetical protein
MDGSSRVTPEAATDPAEQPHALAESQPDRTATSGPATVTTLERLNAEAAKAVYAPLGGNEIRLVKLHAGTESDPIRCSLSAVPEDQPPAYEALSYVCECHTEISRPPKLTCVRKGAAKIMQKPFS